jgi:hypothetical protein
MIQDKIISIAKKEVGYKEYPAGTNKTKFGKWFGFDGVAWCGMFVSWVYHNAGAPLGNIGFTNGFAGCQTAYAYFKKNNMIVEWDKVQKGDIVLYDWNGDGRFDHTGIFERKLGENIFYAYEGNTSVSNQSNGGEVQYRDRDKKFCVFVHPKVLDKKS